MKDFYYSEANSQEHCHWWYRVRRKIVEDIIRAHAKENGPLTILDIGCGSGLLMKKLEPYGQISGMDFSQLAVNFCKQKGLQDVRLGSVTDIPEPDGKYDIVLVLDLIEHVEDDHKALMEIKRVLKKDGIAIIFVPAFMFLWGITDESGMHYRRYTRKGLVLMMRSIGFIISRASYFNAFLFIPISIVRLLSRILPSKRNSDFITGRGLINEVLFMMFLGESYLLKYMNFPFGVSLMAIAKK